MTFVVDASVTLAWYFRDEQNTYAHRMLRRLHDEPAVVPSSWPLEIVNGLLVAERRRRLNPAEVTRVRMDLAELPISWQEMSLDLVLGPVLELGRAQALTAYDAAYLELAMREGLPLATQDEGLRAAAQRVGVPLVD